MANIQIKGLVPGKSYDVQIRAKNGESYSDWSNKLNFTATSDTTAPSTPATPTVWISGNASDYLQTLTTRVKIDGTVSGSPSVKIESDTSYFEVYASSANPGANPTESSGTKVGEVRYARAEGVNSESTIPVPISGSAAISSGSQTYFFIRAVDRSGNKSAFSPSTLPASVNYFANAYISDLSADKITTGTLQANNQISVGTTTPVVIKSNAYAPLAQMYNGTGNFGNIDTPFYLDSYGNFSLLDKVRIYGSNLIKNYNFENGFVSWTTFWAGGATWSVASGEGYSGAALKGVRNTASGTLSVWSVNYGSTFPVLPGEIYYASARVKISPSVSGAGSETVSVGLLTAPTSAGADYFGTGVQLSETVASANASYTLITASFTIPAGHYWMRPTIRVSSSQQTTVWWDDVVYIGQDKISNWTISNTALSSGTGSSYVAISSSGLYSFWAGNATASVAPFSVTNTGSLVSTSASISGSIVATTGSIGNWSISSPKIAYFNSTGSNALFLAAASNTNTSNASNIYIFQGNNADTSANAIAYPHSYFRLEGRYYTGASAVGGSSTWGTNLVTGYKSASAGAEKNIVWYAVAPDNFADPALAGAPAISFDDSNGGTVGHIGAYNSGAAGRLSMEDTTGSAYLSVGNTAVQISSVGATSIDATGSVSVTTSSDFQLNSGRLVNAGGYAIQAYNSDTGIAGYVFRVKSIRASSSAYYLMTADSNNGGSIRFRVRGDGTVTAQGTITGGGADYAEMFEWQDGNVNNEDRIGTVVILNNNGKIEAYDKNVHSESQILGVISFKPTVVGDSAELQWRKKELTDDFGREILEEYSVIQWQETIEGNRKKLVQYIVDEIPQGVEIPQDHEIIEYDNEGNRLLRSKLNPDFDPALEYIPRSQRKEWDAVGLIGKLRIRSDQDKKSGWIKLQDISANVEEWFIK